MDSSKLSGYSLILDNVRYQRADEVQGVLRYEECFFLKRPHFAFEEEVRLNLDTYSRLRPTKKTERGYTLPVQLEILLDRVTVHPDSSDWFLDSVVSVTQKFGIQTEVKRGTHGNR
jgi:hypothetical protein